MDETTALVPIEQEPEEYLARATKIATALARVINDRKLYKVIQDRKYVMVEGWTTLGGIIGVLPREVEVKRLEDGGYEAIVELVRISDGMVVGRASALCGMDESTWSRRAEYARRSMATTRATGKAYRLGYSSIIKLAGFEPTPAEEMPSDTVEGEVHEVPSPKVDRPYSPEILKAKMAERVVANEGRAADKKMMGLMMGTLEMCFAGEEKAIEKRHSVLAYLFGVQSGVDLAPAQVLALREWLKPKPDSGGAWFPDEMAEQEAQACLKARMAQLGQESML